jgi:transposase
VPRFARRTEFFLGTPCCRLQVAVELMPEGTSAHVRPVPRVTTRFGLAQLSHARTWISPVHRFGPASFLFPLRCDACATRRSGRQLKCLWASGTSVSCFRACRRFGESECRRHGWREPFVARRPLPPLSRPCGCSMEELMQALMQRELQGMNEWTVEDVNYPHPRLLEASRLLPYEERAKLPLRLFWPGEVLGYSDRVSATTGERIPMKMKQGAGMTVHPSLDFIAVNAEHPNLTKKPNPALLASQIAHEQAHVEGAPESVAYRKQLEIMKRLGVTDTRAFELVNEWMRLSERAEQIDRESREKKKRDADGGREDLLESRRQGPGGGDVLPHPRSVSCLATRTSGARVCPTSERRLLEGCAGALALMACASDARSRSPLLPSPVVLPAPPSISRLSPARPPRSVRGLGVATGRVTHQFSPTHTPADFLRFRKKVVRAYPDRDLHVVLDNTSTHNTEEARAWLAAHPRVHFHYTPTSASRVNQIEGFFGILTEQSLAVTDLHFARALMEHLRAFLRAWNQNPTPFDRTKPARAIIKSHKRMLDRVSPAVR